MITDTKLQFWINNNLNVLLIGEHGTGKTARVKEAFNKANLKWLYFSAATLDPWVDFIGIPKEVADETGNKYIELIRPKPFATDEVEAIFLDEFNRSPKKVRNAVMELLQFKSINGKKFNNLRIVWAAINPDDVRIEGTDELEYDVEKLDPAQKDRFEVHINVPYRPDKGYFTTVYGSEMADNAIDWWNDMDEKLKRKISPRRLDYALNMYSKGGDVRDVLPADANVTKLVTELKNGSFVKQLKNIFALQNTEQAKSFLSIRNNFDNTIIHILKSDKMLNFFVPCMKEEDLVNLMSIEQKVYKYVQDNFEIYKPLINNIIKSGPESKLAKRLRAEIRIMENEEITAQMSKQLDTLSFSGTNICKPVSNPKYALMFSSLGGQTFTNFINNTAVIQNNIRKGTQYRVGIYHKILANITNYETFSDYLTTLKIIIDIIGTSHKKTIKQHIFHGMPEFFGYLMKKCVTSSGGTETVKSILDKIRTSVSRWNKLEEFIFTNKSLYV